MAATREKRVEVVVGDNKSPNTAAVWVPAKLMTGETAWVGLDTQAARTAGGKISSEPILTVPWEEVEELLEAHFQRLDGVYHRLN